MTRLFFGIILCLLIGITVEAVETGVGKRWQRHVIDQSSQGADGTRLADVNQDGLLDIVTGWEQGGVSRICFHPGYQSVKDLWPSVTVGAAVDVEDALLVDLNSDGVMEVVSCCEGRQQSILVHWAASPDVSSEDGWETIEVSPSVGMFPWMFAIPLDVNGDRQIDLVAGGKGSNAMLGWWELPASPRNVADWKWHPLRKVGWLMSLEAVDMNFDGRLDLLFSDRKGDKRGLYWLENPGQTNLRTQGLWKEHAVGGLGQEVMFFSRGDLSGDSMDEIVVAVRPQTILVLDREKKQPARWREKSLVIPESYGSAKATAVADFNLDGQSEIIFSTENARSPKMALGMFVRDSVSGGSWVCQAISGIDGVKHDLVVPVDLDGDGDLDVLTCEEVKNLGVIWYENPGVSLDP